MVQGNPSRRPSASFQKISGLICRPAIACLVLIFSAIQTQGQSIDFQRDVEPIFRERCHHCHDRAQREGGLRLDRRDDAMKGGDSGPAWIPAEAEGSLLIARVSATDPDLRMPPEGPSLTGEQIELLRRWIDAGAPWKEATEGVDERSAGAHWAWQPITPPIIPSDDRKATAASSPIDQFIRQRLSEDRLQPSLSADRATLIRRIHFDLIGLPPSPEEVDAFVGDNRPDAWERLVDRLLASPQLGERWARHWLDVVHYGDTHGYDKDKLRPHAWPYRDWVIRAFNEDRSYVQMIEQQVAGDQLFPDQPDGIVAQGMISAGPWDFIGHAEVPETKTDGKIARHLDRDDMVANVIGTFCSVTIHCAQCHNHKFDPITQEDYYSLQAVFAALDRADRAYYADPAIGKLAASLSQQRREMEAEQEARLQLLRGQAGEEIVEVERQLAASQKPAGNPTDAFGYHSALNDRADVKKWVQVDLGEAISLSAVSVRPCYDDFNQIGAGFGFPKRYRILGSSVPSFDDASTEVLVDRTRESQPNPGTRPLRFDQLDGRFRYVRLEATELAARSGDFMLAISELEVWDREGVNLAAGKPVEAFDSIEAPARWQKSNLTDGKFPNDASDQPPSHWFALRNQLFEKANPPLFAQWREASELLEQLDQKLKALPPPQLAYVATVHTGSGAFAGTGAGGGMPRPIHLLRRGNIQQPAEPAGPGSLSMLRHAPDRFQMDKGDTEGNRRVELARWIAHRDNPLTWRSIANRIWQYHFGRGIVETSNDFGTMGSAPSHPQLLDWIALRVLESDGSLKQLHRDILLSDTYQQSSAVDSGRQAMGEAIDRDNRLLWKQNRRKLEAEAVRDAVLAVSGTLQGSMGGPGYQDFVIEHPEHSPHYEYHLADPSDWKTWRRSIYRLIVRSQTQPFMTSLDCADPSMRVEKRNESISPIQALTLLNNGLMVTQASHFANRLEREVGGDLELQVERAFRLAIGRAPSEDERQVLLDLRRQSGLANLCRVLMNLNEFHFID